MTEISNGYPYLSIAKKHKVDYSLVLALADVATHDRRNFTHFTAEQLDDTNQELYLDVAAAAKYFKDIQSGAIPFPGT